VRCKNSATWFIIELNELAVSSDRQRAAEGNLGNENDAAKNRMTGRGN